MASRRRIVLTLLTAYALLLALSHAWRAREAEAERSGQGATISIAGVFETAIEVAVRQRCDGPTRPVLLLLHGSPGSSRDFDAIGPELADRFCVVAPDLPGFGASTRQVPDYSIAAHARVVDALLDALEIKEAHVLGFSMGGGVALELSRLAPDRMRSLTLLSAIGVQEAELLGNYHLNRAVHGAQLAALWLLHEAVPHFGVLDDAMLSVEYARNFYDTDQRPLRAILSGLEMPVLILHGRNDPLVPVAAAREHHRIVPQSELVVFDASHFMVFRGGDRLSGPLVDFLGRVEAGTAARRADAPVERVALAERPPGVGLLPRAQGLALFLLMNLLALATFVSEDLASIGAGLLAAHGRISYLAGCVACFAGIFASDVGLYAIGRWLGRPWMRRAPFRWWVSEEALIRSRAWFDERGPSVVFASRFLPGTRVPTYIAAGVVATPFWRFALYLALAVAVWVPILVGLAYFLGVRVFSYFEVFRSWAIPGAAGLALVVWLLLRLVRALGSYRGRRLLVGRWRRLSQWEFWPTWVVYLPVGLYILGLALRYRSLTLFTAANPAIPAGGFVGESKSRILGGISERWVAPFLRVDPAGGEAIEEAHAFADEVGYPVVVKPDVGERGRGVTFAQDRNELARLVAGSPGPVLVQKRIEGPELGVFYVRRPGDERGRIVSVTDKRLPEVVGDGNSTLERLILADQRAAAMAPVYLRRFASRLEAVPTAGERIRLTEVGTHCLGAVFLDGRHFATPALEAAVDEISQSFAGFSFGRYDLKAPSYEAFERGEGLVVLELNGVTSEPTHVYDPAVPLAAAYRAFFRQWKLAFEIGRIHRQRGVKTTSVGELGSLVWRHSIRRPGKRRVR